ncbi:MAG: ammonia-forming cytochrome c nitrite reductase subunit c552, partial [Acidobacteria bacterium]|nr:ammonia-forming cytochrome c nitrite reductase subunit c552 [Acidobacteriota bacterium]
EGFSASPRRMKPHPIYRFDEVKENSMGFHAPQEAVRILGESINYSRQGQVVLRDEKNP